MEFFNKLSIDNNDDNLISKKQKYLIHLKKILKYRISNKHTSITKIFYASNSNSDIIILFTITNDIHYAKLNYIIKLNNLISINTQIQQFKKYINTKSGNILFE